jgi:TfoX/Sxy family transcriptional regulator of competence genes
MCRTLPTRPALPIWARPGRRYARRVAYDEGLAERVRDVLGDAPDVVVKKMFGGIAFMVAGNMACGVIGDDLLVRVPREEWTACLELPFAGPMEMTGRTMRGFVVVDAEGLGEDGQLAAWVERGADTAGSLPPK